MPSYLGCLQAVQNVPNSWSTEFYVDFIGYQVQRQIIFRFPCVDSFEVSFWTPIWRCLLERAHSAWSVCVLVSAEDHRYSRRIKKCSWKWFTMPIRVITWSLCKKASARFTRSHETMYKCMHTRTIEELPPKRVWSLAAVEVRIRWCCRDVDADIIRLQKCEVGFLQPVTAEAAGPTDDRTRGHAFVLNDGAMPRHLDIYRTDKYARCRTRCHDSWIVTVPINMHNAELDVTTVG